jgi:hypothetical protein
MDSIDLSLPFRKTVAKVVQPAMAAASKKATENVGDIVSNLNTKFGWKLWVTAGVLIFVLYYFVGQTKYNPNEVQIPTPIPNNVAPDHLKMADEAFGQFGQTGHPQDYQIAVENYMKALASLGNQAPAQIKGHIFHQLATLYHEGVPEDDNGNGIPPNAQEAIYFYREAIKQGHHDAVLPLASIYHWGLTGYEGNREVSKHLYAVVLKTGTDYEKGLAKDRLRQMREETGQTVGSGMLEDESGVAGNFSTSAFGANPYAENFMDIDRSPFSLGKDETTKDIDEKYVDDLIQNKLGINARQRQTDVKQQQYNKTFKDPQNARDHIVVNSAKQSLERLRANTHIQYDIPTTFKMIHEYILKKSDVSQKKRDTAAHVLREMSKGIANLGYEQSKEIEALHLVWNRIHSQAYAQDAEKRKCLTENLVNELAESMEFGELVCPTGRLNRIIDALNHQDPLVNIQPKWAVQQMMVAKAGDIQKKMLAKSSPETRDAMASKNPSARQRQLQEEFVQKVKSSIEREMTRTYVDTGIMSRDLLKTELDSWIL